MWSFRHTKLFRGDFASTRVIARGLRFRSAVQFRIFRVSGCGIDGGFGSAGGGGCGVDSGLVYHLQQNAAHFSRASCSFATRCSEWNRGPVQLHLSLAGLCALRYVGNPGQAWLSQDNVVRSLVVMLFRSHSAIKNWLFGPLRWSAPTPTDCGGRPRPARNAKNSPPGTGSRTDFWGHTVGL